MQPSAPRGETSGPRPKRYDVLAGIELAPARRRLLLAREAVSQTNGIGAKQQRLGGDRRGRCQESS
jgi:hypothetical protein